MVCIRVVSTLAMPGTSAETADAATKQRFCSWCRPPRTVLDFFKPKDSKAAATTASAARKPQQQQQQQAAQRKGSAKALAEISMNADHPNKKPKQAASSEAIDLISASDTLDLTTDMKDVHKDAPIAKRQRRSAEHEAQLLEEQIGHQQTEPNLDANTQQQAKPDRSAYPRQGNNAMQSRQPAAMQKRPPDPQPGADAEDKTAAIFKRRLSSSHMPPSHLIAELTGMGFSYEHAVQALRASNGDIQRAVHWAVDIASKSGD